MQNNNCNYFNNNKCKSCSLLDTKNNIEIPESIKAFLKPWERCSYPFQSRAKAKMSVTGTKSKPVIGILDSNLNGVELLNCPLHLPIINKSISQLANKLINIEPYSIKNRTGNLKGIILQTNLKQNHIRIRYIAKDESDIENYKQIKLEADCLVSTSVNIQNIPHQILEGEVEYHLEGEEILWEEYNEIKVGFPAQSFMQVTPEIASKLYHKASQIIKINKCNNVIDLFCGAGGFALSVAKNCKKTFGIELSAQAIKAAKASAKENGLNNIEFTNADLLSSLPDIQADAVICNPPRRGLGQKVIKYLKESKPNLILYSSCEINNFLKDYFELETLYSLKEVTPFEMFPLTKHFEVLAVLEKR